MTKQVFSWQKDGRGDTIKSATLTVDGFDVTIRVVNDYEHNWAETRGRFTSKRQEGALKNPHAQYDRDAYKYFVPDATVAATIRDYLEMGWTIQAARKQAVMQVREDMEIAIDPDNSTLIAVAVTATVRKSGVTLGKDSLWGIEVDYDDTENYIIDECARDCMHGALKEARKKLAALLASAQVIGDMH
jgi:hypothetical protein